MSSNMSNIKQNLNQLIRQLEPLSLKNWSLQIIQSHEDLQLILKPTNKDEQISFCG